MTRYALLILAALVGSCAQFTDAVNVDVRENDLTEETESIMPIRCSPIPVSLSPSSSVHNLTFVDISSVYVLGTPLSYRDEASRVVNRVTEMLSMFNPDVITQHVDQTSVQPRSLLEEAEELSLSLSHQVTNWKLVLLFVQANSTCACSPHVAADATAVVQDVEAALQLLQKRLPRTLVHVVVWSTIQQDKCECMRDESINQRLYKATLLKRLQDSLSRVLENPKWHSDRVDFTAMLQSAPVILEPDSDSESDSENTRSDLNQIAVQLWTNLLQPSTGQAEVMDTSVITIPCPTQKRSFLRRQNSPSESQGRGLSRASTRTDPVMGTVIPCTDRSPSPTTPTSVHELRPGDIKVVAAVGDSLTAANGVGAPWNNLLLVVREYRGLSWSIGGDKNIADVTTLPNILREFNPSLTGFSKGTGNQDSPGASLNQAVAGAKSGDMVRQVYVLVDKMKANSGIDFHNDWKVITMFIGGNDMCDFCKDSVFFSPRNVIGRIRQALDILHNEVPRAIVNLVELLDMVPLRDLHNDKTLSCPTWLVSSVCRCILKPNEGSPDLQKVINLNKAYQRAMRELIDSGRYDTHHHFTVVLQPFLREVILPRLEDGRPDRSYFSPDCFHLSQKAHTLMAQALWNNMLEPVGNKTFRQDFSAGIDLKCPSEEHPYIFTNVNSLPDSTTTPAPTIASVNSDYTFPGPPPTSAPATEHPYIFTEVNSLPDSTTTPAPTIASVNSDYTFPGPPPTSAPATEHPYIFTNVNSLPDLTTTPAPTIASVNSDYTFPGPPPTSAPATEHPYIFTNVNSLPDSTTTPAPTIASVNSNYTFPGPPPTSAPATNWGSDFSCVNTTPSNSVPTSVHRLRPADIKVVAALGDSLTAGFGAKAKNHLQLRTEYRGVSWSIGGDKTLETVTTLPNILKKFNPKIKGASKGQGKWQTGFNMAVSGAKISGIPEQVRRLIDTMKNTTTVDFENDWKLVTLFIGGNDLCQYCNDRASMSPQNYSRHMMTSLDMLYNEVPRTIVNVLEILEIEGLRRIKRDSLGCSLLQKFICPCFLLPGEDSPELAEVKRINRELQVATEKLVYGGRYDEREDFAVVVQSFFRNSIVPLNADGRPDTTYFSVDCFHFSERGHAYMAAALWSNMLEPVGKKQTYTNFTNTRSNIKCPTEEHPYIFTKVNSLPDSTTTTAPTTHKTTSQPQSSDCNVDVPVWLAAVLAVIGLLIGSAVTWLLLSCRAKRSKQMMTAAVELKGTVF